MTGIVSYHVHTCRSVRGGFEARLLQRRRTSRQGIVIKVVAAETRDRARGALRRWLNQPDGMSAFERACADLCKRT